ncbi:MAG: hypothetical protein GY789_24150 [Hyphomicrobiales bacterium]|nr:hypothetical protein [Hyphomicrobiales bacterium]
MESWKLGKIDQGKIRLILGRTEKAEVSIFSAADKFAHELLWIIIEPRQLPIICEQRPAGFRYDAVCCAALAQIKRDTPGMGIENIERTRQFVSALYA